MNSPTRCPWSDQFSGAGRADYIEYHDNEWGMPLHDERKLFELLILEGAQAGLSWATILAKRENYRRAFDGFDPEIIARYSPDKIESLLQDTGIVRNRLKVNAAVSNAQAYLNLRDNLGGLDPFFWRYVDDKAVQNHWHSITDVPSQTALSDRISKDLSKLGFKFVGSTIVYAHLQAMGLVNDHLVSCFRHAECAAASHQQRG